MLQLLWWQGVIFEANRDGYKHIPRSTLTNSQFPTRADTEARKALEENNSAYVEYLQKPELLFRARDRAIPLLEEAFLRSPTREFRVPFGRRVPKLNGPSSRPLVLEVILESGSIGRRPFDTHTTKSFTQALAVAFLGHNMNRQRFEGRFRFIDKATGEIISEHRVAYIHTRNRKTEELAEADIQIFADRIWFSYTSPQWIR